jgi:hypothetical protein
MMKTVRCGSSSSMRMTNPVASAVASVITDGGYYDTSSLSSTITLQQQLRWKSSSSSSSNGNSGSNNKKSTSFRPRRAPAGNSSKGNGYYYNRHTENGKLLRKQRKEEGVKEPYDIKTSIPKINKSQIKITDCLLDADENEDDDLTELGTLMGGALRSLRAEQDNMTTSQSQDNELENQLRVMDFFISADGSTEDLIGSRRAVTSDTPLINADTMLDRIDSLVDQERFEYMELPKTDHITQADILKGNDASSGGGGGGNTIGQIPANQLAHGDW